MSPTVEIGFFRDCRGQHNKPLQKGQGCTKVDTITTTTTMWEVVGGRCAANCGRKEKHTDTKQELFCLRQLTRGRLPAAKRRWANGATECFQQKETPFVICAHSSKFANCCRLRVQTNIVLLGLKSQGSTTLLPLSLSKYNDDSLYATSLLTTDLLPC